MADATHESPDLQVGAEPTQEEIKDHPLTEQGQKYDKSVEETAKSYEKVVENWVKDNIDRWEEEGEVQLRAEAARIGGKAPQLIDKLIGEKKDENPQRAAELDPSVATEAPVVVPEGTVTEPAVADDSQDEKDTKVTPEVPKTQDVKPKAAAKKDEK